MLSEAEKFIQSVTAGEVAPSEAAQLEAQVAALQRQAEEQQRKVDALYQSAFEGFQWPEHDGEASVGGSLAEECAQLGIDFSDMSEAKFGQLGRSSPKASCSPYGRRGELEVV
ncbi:hypothetical protein N2152v2_009048 [Parachlorella kessleri]